jgi:hypothetical protein
MTRGQNSLTRKRYVSAWGFCGFCVSAFATVLPSSNIFFSFAIPTAVHSSIAFGETGAPAPAEHGEEMAPASKKSEPAHNADKNTEHKDASHTAEAEGDAAQGEKEQAEGTASKSTEGKPDSSHAGTENPHSPLKEAQGKGLIWFGAAVVILLLAFFLFT